MNKHPLGIPTITVKDHNQYNELKSWAEEQKWKPPEEIKRAIMYERLTGRPYPEPKKDNTK
jgi:hypothetical protein